MKTEKALLFFAFLIIALTAVALFRHGTLWWDETVYLSLADSIYSRHEYAFNINSEEEFRAPMLPAMIAGMYILLGHSLASAKIAILASSILFALASYLLGKKLYGEKAGAIAALLAVSASEFVFWSSKVLSEIPALLSVTVSLYLIYVIIEEKKTRLYPLLGAAFAFAALTRYTLLLLPAFFVLWAIYRKRWNLFLDRQAIFGALLFIIILIPWLYNSYGAYGSIFGSMKYNVYIVNDLHSGSWITYAKDFLPAYGILGVIFIAGAAYAIKRRDNKSIFLVSWFVLLFLMLSFAIGEKQIRYLFVALPSIALVSSREISLAFARLEKKNALLVCGVIAIIALLSFIPTFERAYTNKNIGLIIEDAGAYLREHAPEGTRIMSQSTPPFYYYAKREVIWFPKDEWAVMDFMGRYNVSYVEVDNYVWYPDYALNYFGNNKNFAIEYNKTEGDKFIRLYRYLNG